MSEFVDREIKAMVADGELVIDPFLPERLNGASYDLTLGPWFWRRVVGSDVDVYDGDQSRRFSLVDARGSGEITLAPGESVLAHSNEVVGGWGGINTQVHATSTAGRNDLSACLCAGFGDPGFVNIWTLEVHYFGAQALTLRVGTVIAQAQFRPVARPDRVYGVGGVGRYQRHGRGLSAADIRRRWTPDDMLPRAMKAWGGWRDLWPTTAG